MSKKNNSEKDDMNDFDPYNFFKLSGPDDNKNNKNKNKKPRRNFSFLGFLLLLLIVLTVVQLNFPGKLSVSEVEFSRFREMVIDGQIVEVEIGENYYIGYGPKVVLPVEDADKEEKGFRCFAKKLPPERPVLSTRRAVIRFPSSLSFLTKRKLRTSSLQSRTTRLFLC